MRVSLCNEVVRDLPIAQQAAFAAALGYDGLEIAPFTLDAEKPHAPGAETIAQVRRAAGDAGIVVSGLHWLLVAPAGLSITSADRAVQDKTREVMRGLVDLCAELGGAYLVHGSPAQRQLAPGDEAEGRKRGLDFFADAARRAEPAGVTYILEPLSPDQTNYVTTVAEASDIVRRDRIAGLPHHDRLLRGRHQRGRTHPRSAPASISPAVSSPTSTSTIRTGAGRGRAISISRPSCRR